MSIQHVGIQHVYIYTTCGHTTCIYNMWAYNMSIQHVGIQYVHTTYGHIFIRRIQRPNMIAHQRRHSYASQNKQLLSCRHGFNIRTNAVRARTHGHTIGAPFLPAHMGTQLEHHSCPHTHRHWNKYHSSRPTANRANMVCLQKQWSNQTKN